MEKRLKIIGGLVREYSSVWLVTVPQMTVVPYETTTDSVIEEMSEYEENSSNYDTAFQCYAKKHLGEDERQDFLNSVSYENVRSKIEQMPVYKVIYKRQGADAQEYYQITFARAMPDDECMDFVVGFKNVDVEAREREQRREALEAALAAAEQANHSKTAFLNNISHDIRTPMNGIIGMTAIAGAHLDDTERVKECLDKISLASNHLVALINDVLDVSRIESGRVFLSKEEFCMADQFENMANIIMPQIRAKDQILSLEIHEVLHEHVIGDPLRLQQVFMNIVGNAIKYTPNGGKISIALWEDTEDADGYSKYIFTCEDSGYGMTQEFMSRLFQPFERAEDERLKNVQGTGLGMAITKNLVRMMNGDIKVESEYGKGSRFTVTFCLERQSAAPEYSGTLQNVPVLLVNSDPEFCRETCQVLDDLGMDSSYVCSAGQAIDAVRTSYEQHRGYKVCLIDQRLETMDGIALTAAIRKLPHGELPVIVLYDYDWINIEAQARAAGANAFITRPLFRSRLNQTIKNVLTGEKTGSIHGVLEEYGEKDYSGKRVLLVEDNELNMEIAREILGMTGVEVETAENGRDALEMFEEHGQGYYDMIFMDIQMPVMDGYRATRAIRQLNRSDAVTIPIVAMSANAFMEDMESSRRVGMNDHIAKPISLPRLLGVMENYLGTRREIYVPFHPEYTEDGEQKPRTASAKYYEELYFIDGNTEISEETERACINVLNKNGAVGIFGLLEQKDYPIYFVSGFALTSLGYTYEEMMEASHGHFMDLIYEDDKKRVRTELYKKGCHHQYRMIAKSGKILRVSSYVADSYLVDGKRTRILSMRVESSSE